MEHIDHLADISKPNIYDRLFILNRNIWKFSLLRLGVGCLAVAFLAMLVAVTILKSMPNIRKSISTIETKEGQL
jgi:hypothetical protein